VVGKANAAGYVACHETYLATHKDSSQFSGAINDELIPSVEHLIVPCHHPELQFQSIPTFVLSQASAGRTIECSFQIIASSTGRSWQWPTWPKVGKGRAENWATWPYLARAEDRHWWATGLIRTGLRPPTRSPKTSCVVDCFGDSTRNLLSVSWRSSPPFRIPSLCLFLDADAVVVRASRDVTCLRARCHMILRPPVHASSRSFQFLRSRRIHCHLSQTTSYASWSGPGIVMGRIWLHRFCTANRHAHAG
jgi:hypothetical protein